MLSCLIRSFFAFFLRSSFVDVKQSTFNKWPLGKQLENETYCFL